MGRVISETSATSGLRQKVLRWVSVEKIVNVKETWRYLCLWFTDGHCHGLATRDSLGQKY